MSRILVQFGQSIGAASEPMLALPLHTVPRVLYVEFSAASRKFWSRGCKPFSSMHHFRLDGD
jgi:hypothetical protein